MHRLDLDYALLWKNVPDYVVQNPCWKIMARRGPHPARFRRRTLDHSDTILTLGASKACMRWRRFAFLLPILLRPAALAQQSAMVSEANAALAPPSISEKWNLFETETFSPMTPGAAAFNAALSQITDSMPLYSREFFPGYPSRFGAAVGDIVTQNFFGDFLLASALHEDTRYVRRGPQHKLLSRIVYAISRSVITRTDTGDSTLNLSNVMGTAMSAAVSNAYYPPASRNGGATATNWGTSVAGSGFANLLPEFWPDFHGWIKRRFQH